MNERSVFDTLLDRRMLTCADLVDVTGISKPTVTQAIRTLEARHLVRSCGLTSGRVGRAGQLFEVAPAGAFVVAVDIGVSLVRVATADLRGQLIDRRDQLTPGNDLTAILELTSSMVAEVCAASTAARGQISAAVVGSPGAVDPRRRSLTHCGALSCLEGVDLVARLGTSTGLPWEMENDVNLAALGEQRFGHRASDMVVLSVGDGVGAAIVLDDRLIRGSRGAAGEIESVPFDQSSRRRAGLPPTTRASLTRYIAVRVSALAAITDAQLVVLTGRIGADPALLGSVRALVTQHLGEPPRIECSQLGVDAVLLGGLAVAHDRAVDLLFSSDRSSDASSATGRAS